MSVTSPGFRHSLCIYIDRLDSSIDSTETQPCLFNGRHARSSAWFLIVSSVGDVWRRHILLVPGEESEGDYSETTRRTRAHLGAIDTTIIRLS